MKLEESIQKKAQDWSSNTYFDFETRKEVSELLEKKETKELTERFYKELEFGTGGLRGLVGAGCSRINQYTIRKATTALCVYLRKQHGEKSSLSVGISYDSRLTSKDLAKVASEVLAYYNIKVYLTKDLRPTPMLSFLVRHFSCHAGLCITASHNPSSYNGYKVYWQDGGQLVPPHDKKIIEEYKAIDDYSSLQFMAFDEAFRSGLIKYCDEELDKAYLEILKKISYQEVKLKNQKIVYTPLHGAGIVVLPKALSLCGYANVYLVPEQENPDGHFPTVKSPNPEDPESLYLAKKLADKLGSHLVLATDPDADRLAVSIKDKSVWVDLNGNQLAALLVNYILCSLKQKNLISDKSYIVKTIVTTDLLSELAKFYNCECIETLTGFKWIAEAIHLKDALSKTFLCGGEESLGFLAKDFVRDKDAVSTALLVCEMVSYYEERNQNLLLVLDSIYERHGVYYEALETLTLPGKDGKLKIDKIMEFARGHNLDKILGYKMQELVDYREQVKINYGSSSAKVKWDVLPKSNVLSFLFHGQYKLMIRPSGTEAKIKFYFSHCSTSTSEVSDTPIASYKNKIYLELNQFKERVMSSFGDIISSLG